MQPLQLSEYIAPPPPPVSVVLTFELNGKLDEFESLSRALDLDIANYIHAKEASDEGFERLWSRLQQIRPSSRAHEAYRRLWDHVDRLDAWERATRGYIARSNAPHLRQESSLGPELGELVLRARKQHYRMLEAMERYAQRLQQVRERLEDFLDSRAPRDRRELEFLKAAKLETHFDELELEDAD